MQIRRHRRAGFVALLTTGLAISLLPLASAGAASSSAATPATHWLCNPVTLANDPCRVNLDYAVVPPVGVSIVNSVTVPRHPPVDCFYAYPTVSPEPTANADLRIQPAERDVATIQAAPFSQVCRVFAPIYRQVTKLGLGGIALRTPRRSIDIAYDSLRQGFRAFLAQEPSSRPFVLIGHSQGAAMLIRLAKEMIDNNVVLRRRLVSAIVIGGNLTVKTNKNLGGAFQHIPICTSGHEIGCAIAYSSFYDQPPRSSLFGIPGQGVSWMWGQLRRKGLQVACVNPGRFGLGSTRLNVRFFDPAAPGASWVTYPGLYRGFCQSSKGATFLHVTVEPATAYPAAAHPNQRPVLRSWGPLWGLHAADVNLGMGDLVAIVAREEFFLKSGR